ncbi:MULTISPECIES: response regulator [Deinococcus]|uniref:response regulator n=1 Tax=Deinococcus TaxID=1298 RepID=UPI0004884497|nr:MULTISPECIES: response regulator [Deinococcus]KEF34838.1 response regulator [Deinococcus sp. RL]
MERRRILLVDDNPHDVELALDALQDRGAEVEVAASGPEALAALCGAKLPDLILLDLKMPQMDGLAVLDQIRSRSATRDLPVVMLSTSGEERDVADCYAHGATAYVVKPMDFGQFRAALRTITDFWAQLNVRPRLR